MSKELHIQTALDFFGWEDLHWKECRECRDEQRCSEWRAKAKPITDYFRDPSKKKEEDTR